jgi:hypothetical protein
MKTIDTTTIGEGIALRKPSRIAGWAYLLIIIIPGLSMLIISPKITVNDDVVATINNIVANEVLYRIDSTITLLMFVAVVILALALYDILMPVNKPLAKLALFWRYAEALIGIIATLGNFLLLSFITGENNLERFGTEKFYALSELLLGIYWESTIIIFVLLGIGSIIVFYLFFKTTLIPKALSIWGILSYSLVLIGALIGLIFSGDTYLILGSQTILFELVIGCWLLFKGLHVTEK